MQKDANLVELEKSCRTHIFLQNLVLIKPGTSSPKICKILQNFVWFPYVEPRSRSARARASWSSPGRRDLGRPRCRRTDGREGLKYDFCQISRLVSVGILAEVVERMPFVEEFILRVKISIRSRRRGRDATTKDA